MARFSDVFKGIVHLLRSLGYRVYGDPSDMKLNTLDISLPQRRERMYLVAIQENCLHHEYKRPPAQGKPKSIRHFLDPEGPTDSPGELPKNDLARHHVKKAFKKCENQAA